MTATAQLVTASKDDAVLVPNRAVRNQGRTRTVEVLGARRDVSVMLVADDVSVDDWVVVHVGFAIGRIDADTI